MTLELANQFFYLFSRFEFALKLYGYHNGDGEAKPNWDKFASTVKDNFDQNEPRIFEAYQYYFKHPPKKQKISDGNLVWENSEQDENLHGLLCYIRRVRNNLFHGGKFPNKHLEHQRRNTELISYAIDLLNYCSELLPEIKKVIESVEENHI